MNKKSKPVQNKEKFTKFKPKLPSDILYQKLVEYMNEGLWMGDKQERTVYANPKFCKMTEYSLEEMLGRKSYDFWAPESAKMVKSVNLHKRKKGVSSQYEGNLITKSGKRIPVLLSGTPLPDGGTFGIMTDLTKLREKEKSERILNRAIDHATDAIIVFDKSGKVRAWNRGAKIIFGYKKKEMMTEKVDKIFSMKDFGDYFQNPSNIYNFEILAKHKNEHSLNIAGTLTTIVDDEAEDRCFFLLIGRDISQQTKFEHELALKYQKIQEAYNKFGIIRRQMDYVFEILDLLNTYHDQRSVADFIVSSLIMLTKADTCVLRLYNKQKDTLDLLSSFGTADWKGKAVIKYPNSLAQKAFEQKRSLKVIDITYEPRYQSVYLAKKNNLSSLLLIPLVFHSELIGTVSLYVRPDKKLKIFENEFIEKYAKLIELVMGITFRQD